MTSNKREQHRAKTARIAAALVANGNAYHDGRIEYDAWARRNVELWDRARSIGIDAAVMHILTERTKS